MSYLLSLNKGSIAHFSGEFGLGCIWAVNSLHWQSGVLGTMGVSCLGEP